MWIMLRQRNQTRGRRRTRDTRTSRERRNPARQLSAGHGAIQRAVAGVTRRPRHRGLILRAETAALTTVANVMYELED